MTGSGHRDAILIVFEKRIFKKNILEQNQSWIIRSINLKEVDVAQRRFDATFTFRRQGAFLASSALLESAPAS
jgi:hypothetical protein